MRQKILSVDHSRATTTASSSAAVAMCSSDSAAASPASTMLYPLHLLLGCSSPEHLQTLQIMPDNAKSHKQYQECRRAIEGGERPAFSPRSTSKTKAVGPPRKPGRWESACPATHATIKLHHDCRPTMPAKRGDGRRNVMNTTIKSLSNSDDMDTRFALHCSNRNKRSLRMPERRLSFEQDLTTTVQVIERVLSELDLEDDDHHEEEEEDDNDSSLSDMVRVHAASLHGRRTSDLSAATV